MVTAGRDLHKRCITACARYALCAVLAEHRRLRAPSRHARWTRRLDRGIRSRHARRPRQAALAFSPTGAVYRPSPHTKPQHIL